MKKFLLTLLLFAFGSNCLYAYDFSIIDTTSTGHTLYYRYVSDSSGSSVRTVVYVTCPGGSNWSGYEKPTGTLIIPSSVVHVGVTYPVAGIDRNAFYCCRELTNVVIPSSVMVIGDEAFYSCSGLVSVTIPNSVDSIGFAAFSSCRELTSVIIPSSVTSISDEAFISCSNLASVVIPNSVTSIGNYAFATCSSLTNIVIPNSVTTIGDAAFANCSGLTSVTIGDSVTSIGDYAFYDCGCLTDVDIPNSVTSIGFNAFYNVRNLVYSGTATGSPWGALSVNGFIDGYFVYSDETRTSLLGCSPQASGSITIPNSVTSIGDYAFRNCSNVTSIDIPNSVTSIGYAAFYNCTGLTSISIPNSLTSIDEGTFNNCSGLTSIVIPNSVTSIGNGAFYNCSGLVSVTIPNSVTSIGNTVFYNCSGLVSVKIGDSVTSVGSYAFYRCSRLASAVIGSSVDSLGESSFAGCINLNNIATHAHTAPTLGVNAFQSVPNTATIAIPCGSSESYHSNWSYFSNFLEGSGYLFLVESADETMGSISILTEPTCTTSTAEFQAIPNDGYEFDHWSDGSMDNPRVLDVTQDTSIIGYFVAIQGIGEVEKPQYIVAAGYGYIAIRGAEGQRIRILDAWGRQLFCDYNAAVSRTVNVPVSGCYFVQIGENTPASKVFVIK